jgi:toxin ParE1/3/4
LRWQRISRARQYRLEEAFLICGDADCQIEWDIELILAWTHEEFGEESRTRYEALLIQAILDVAESPERAGSRDRPEIAVSARTYHLRHSRDWVKKSIGKVRWPRNFLLYRTLGVGGVEIGRVLHDGMDLKRHLPAEYRAGQDKPQAGDESNSTSPSA